MLYKFTAEDDFGNVVFTAEKPTLEMLEEEQGRFERQYQKNKE